MTSFSLPRVWETASDDPNDETFGDVIEGIDRGSKPLETTADVALVGEPFDAAVVGTRGAARGPEAIRDQLEGVKTHHFVRSRAAAAREIRDLGDVQISSMDARTIQRQLQGITEALYDGRTLPVFLGGDNSLTVANAGPLVDSGSVGVVNFDAHLDVREVQGAPTSGTPYRQLFEDGLDAYACVGARHFETSSEYVGYLAEQEGTVVTSETVGHSLDDALAQAREAVSGVDALFVSVDCDVLDTTAAPGVSAPTPGGIASRELFELLRRLAADDRIAGFEVVECAPPLENGDRTAAAAARAIAHFLAGYWGSSR
jgi:formimidoylglutamase